MALAPGGGGGGGGVSNIKGVFQIIALPPKLSGQITCSPSPHHGKYTIMRAIMEKTSEKIRKNYNVRLGV